ncbi:hypothetical protein [Pseudomonas sp.]|uniref:hypothetical protein n=1 Tax=Pseudomonas sp. TaxID=306 RepID=UPI00257C341A|nr:hypothetical protein [Pseudomonas sp.]
MRLTSFYRKLLIAIVGFIAWLPPQTFAAEIIPQEQIQIYASRATSSLLLLRGEGFQEVHKQRLDNDLAALAAAMNQVEQPSAELTASHAALVTQLQNGVSYGPGDENVPWRYPEDLSKSLREFLHAARQQPSEAHSELPAKIEYLSVQYLSRSYMGTFEIAREQPDTYLGQDERQLVPDIDQELAKLAKTDTPAALKLHARWEYLKAALTDMNSKSNTLQSVSGRPFAPITVDRHSRVLTQNWMAMQ